MADVIIITQVPRGGHHTASAISDVADPYTEACTYQIRRAAGAGRGREGILSKQATAIAMTSNADSADPAVSRFLDAVWMERGLSPNTLAAYRADLTALSRWLAERDVSIMNTSRADLLGFIAWRVQTGARPRSTARQLSSFR